MKPPTKNLFGGVEELHTREYLLKISAQMMGCGERSKITSKNSKYASSRTKTCVFGERGREGKKTYLERGPMGPRRPVGAGRGHAAPAGRPGHWWLPLVSPRCP